MEDLPPRRRRRKPQNSRSSERARRSRESARRPKRRRPRRREFEFTRERIFGIIGIIWGGSVVMFGMCAGISGRGGYAAGSCCALMFGALMFVSGIYYTIRG